jgi:hypothetical protein
MVKGLKRRKIRFLGIILGSPKKPSSCVWSRRVNGNEPTDSGGFPRTSLHPSGYVSSQSHL